MKILFVVPYVPNPIRVRSYELLRTLAARGHQITLATLWQNAEERHDIAALTALGIQVVAQPLPKLRSLWNSALAVPTRTPLQARYCWQPALAALLTQLVTEQCFDVAHVEHLRGAAYGLLLRKVANESGIRLPIVWDSVDCISHLFAQAARQSRSRQGRLMTTLELPRTQRYEGWLLDQFERTLITSKSDQQAMLQLNGRQHTQHVHRAAYVPAAPQPIVLPNGVDLSDCTQLPDHGAGHARASNSSSPVIVFSGKMSYHANVTAALYLVQEIMPAVWSEHPEVKVQIVGKDPPKEICALATPSSATARAVEVTGQVATIRPYLQAATLAVAPLLYGAGIQNKVLEAMACGTPVIASKQAAAGIPAQLGRDLLVADGAAAFATTICQLLNAPEERQTIGQAGRAYVETMHGWPRIAAQLERIYLDVTSDVAMTSK